MRMNKQCSKILKCSILLKIECVHCGAANYIDDEQRLDTNDLSISTLEALTCWSCNEDSLIDESLLEFYPEFPEDTADGYAEGKPVAPIFS